MGWCGGGELAEEVWVAVRNLVPVGRGRMVAARKIIDLFERCDCDTIIEAESLCAVAGYVYDEGRDEHVYTSLPPDKGDTRAGEVPGLNIYLGGSDACQ